MKIGKKYRCTAELNPSDPWKVGDILTYAEPALSEGFGFTKEYPTNCVCADYFEEVTSQEEDEWLSRFSFHTPDQTGKDAMRNIRIKVRELAALVSDTCPAGREKEDAFSYLQVVMMKANSAIVQQYPIDPSDLTLEGK